MDKFFDITKFVKQECTTCNVAEMHDLNIRCNDCMFLIYSGQRSSSGTIIFNNRMFNLHNKYRVKKHELFYFSNNLNLDWKYPIGESYQIHHINNNHFDDNTVNLKLMTRSEHVSLHNKQGDIGFKSGSLNIANILVENGTHNNIKQWEGVRLWLESIELNKKTHLTNDLAKSLNYSNITNFRIGLSKILTRDKIEFSLFNTNTTKNNALNNWFLVIKE